MERWRKDRQLNPDAFNDATGQTLTGSSIFLYVD